MTKKLYKFSEIINLQVKKIMKKNNKVICYGLGIMIQSLSFEQRFTKTIWK